MHIILGRLTATTTKAIEPNRTEPNNSNNKCSLYIQTKRNNIQHAPTQHTHTHGLEYYDFAKQFAISTNAMCVCVSALCRLLAKIHYCTLKILTNTYSCTNAHTHTHMIGHIDIPTH